MDTNQFSMLLSALDRARVTGGIDPFMQLMVVSFAALSPVIAALAAYWAKRAMSATEASKVSTHEAKVTAGDMATSVEKIHLAVNSERATILAELKTLREELLEATRAKAQLEERLRRDDLVHAQAQPLLIQKLSEFLDRQPTLRAKHHGKHTK